MAKSWDNANYPKRREVTVQEANIDTDLANFPLLLKLPDSLIAAGDIASRRYQLYDWQGNKVAYSQESYSEGTHAQFETHCKAPLLKHLPAVGNNKFYLYYGYDPGTDQDDPANVWDSHYKAVLHLGEAADPYLDDTANNCDSDGTGNDPTQVSGRIGYGQSFNGSNNYISLGDKANLDVGANEDFTIDLWVKPDLADVNGNFIRKWDETNGYWLGQTGVGTGHYYWLLEFDGTLVQQYSYLSQPKAGSWAHIALAVDRDGDASFYCGGGCEYGVDVSAHAAKDISNSASFLIGGFASWFANAVLDEVRFSKTLRSAAWLKFQVRNVDQADNELTWGSEETRPGVLLRLHQEGLFVGCRA